MAGARGAWNSRFGFIMAAVGSAVGLGNLVRFPRELAGNGGAAFLFVYLLLLLLVGLPAMLGELSLGKMTRMSPVNAFRKLAGGEGKKWGYVGVAGMLAAMFVLFFYTVMTGWTVQFFAEGVSGLWGDIGWMEKPGTYFDGVAVGPMTIFWHGIVAALVVFVVGRGVSGGIEKVVIVVMPTLFLILAGIVIYALFQPGMGAGYEALFKPDFGALSPTNISAAVGQVFFSLSLGQGAMLTYASYMDKKQSVTKDGTITALADTGVAVVAGMMIFPILGFTGLLTDPGTQETMDGGSFGTAFKALPAAFNSMGEVTGAIVGTIFFMGLFFAAFSSAISLLEVPVSVLIDNGGLSRFKATLLAGLVVYTFGVISSINENWFVLFDEIAINFFIVIGVAVTTLFAGWKVKGLAKELDSGLKSRVGIYAVWMMRTVTPVLIIAVFIFGGLVGTDANGNLEFWSHGYENEYGNVKGQAGWFKLFEHFKAAFGGGH